LTSEAQDKPIVAESQPFNQTVWEQSVKELDYNRDEGRSLFDEQKKRYNIKDKTTKEPDKEPDKKLPNTPNMDGFASFIKFAAILIGIILIGVLIYYFVGGLGTSDKQLEKEQLLSEVEQIEDNLPEANIETPLEKAIRMGEYKVAIRLYYLLIIQQLALKNHIKWRKDKTNREYAREIKHQLYLTPFMSLTMAYEKAWFGAEEVKIEDFQHIQSLFEDLKRKISIV
jgi:hypothetical protein